MRLRQWLLAWAILASAGCEGTEVGNPEVKENVTAQFNSYDGSGSLHVTSLSLKVMRMDYVYASPGSTEDSGTCWYRPTGTLVDWASDNIDSTGLPDTSVSAGTWIRSVLVLRTPEGSATLPDSADIRTWSNPRYAKFYLIQNRDSLPALFEMPQGMEMRLNYGEAHMADWNYANTVWVQVLFNAGKWLGPLGVRGAWTTRLDGKQARYVLFSQTENAQAWNGLKDRLPISFLADSVQVR
jgi:hypothetical protein